MVALLCIRCDLLLPMFLLVCVCFCIGWLHLWALAELIEMMCGLWTSVNSCIMGAQIPHGNGTFQGTRACQGLLVVDILNVVHERAALMQLHAVNFFAKVLECSQSTVWFSASVLFVQWPSRRSRNCQALVLVQNLITGVHLPITGCHRLVVFGVRTAEPTTSMSCRLLPFCDSALLVWVSSVLIQQYHWR